MPTIPPPPGGASHAPRLHREDPGEGVRKHPSSAGACSVGLSASITGPRDRSSFCNPRPDLGLAGVSDGRGRGPAQAPAPVRLERAAASSSEARLIFSIEARTTRSQTGGSLLTGMTTTRTPCRSKRIRYVSDSLSTLVRDAVRRSASARMASSDVRTVCSQAAATRPPHHFPSAHRSVPSSPV